MKNNVVVTGFLGYIGFNLTVTLLRLGFNVIGVDKKAENGEVSRFFKTTGFTCNANFKCFKADLSNIKETQDFIAWCKQQKIKAHTIVHLSADTSITESLRNPCQVVGNNLLTTYSANLICHALKCENFVHANSITEIDCENNWNPYSWSKRLSDSVLHSKTLFTDVLYKGVIITNPFGSLVGVERNGNALEQNIRNCIYGGSTLKLSVDKDGVYDTRFRRNFISMYELITVFVYVITKPACCGYTYVNAGVVTPENELANYSVTELAGYFNSFHNMDIQYVNDDSFTRIRTVPANATVQNNEYELSRSMLSDMITIMFDPPKYFNEQQKQTLQELHNLFNDKLDKLYCQKIRFDILYKTFILSQEAINKCCIS